MMDDIRSDLAEIEHVLAPARRAQQLPLATPDSLSQWTAFLQADARREGGTAGVLLHDGSGGLVKVVACSQVVVTELITDPIDVVVELREFYAAGT